MVSEGKGGRASDKYDSNAQCAIRHRRCGRVRLPKSRTRKQLHEVTITERRVDDSKR